MNETPHIPALGVVSEEFSSSHDLVAYLDAEAPLLFRRQQRGIVGQGVAVEAHFSGPNRFSDASAWWQGLRAAATITNPIGRPCSGLVGFAQFSFSPRSTRTSRLVIPSIVLGRDEEGWWVTRIGEEAGDPVLSPEAVDGHPTVAWESSPMSEDTYMRDVETLTTEMRQSALHKVVLARQLVGTSSQPLSLFRAVGALVTAYPDTHLFAMGGFVGASPETLASIRDNTLSLRVLAGSAARGTDPDSDAHRATLLATSTKDLDEHEYAVISVVDSLSHAGLSAVVAESPHALKLPNLWHLATDIHAHLPERTCALDIVGALHPTAAVAGTPTELALDAIERHEPFDRGYFAGPIGWLDGEGNGEFAIALRCAELGDDRTRVIAHAGAGIVKDSDPSSELLETTLKFRPIVDAFSST